CSHQRRLERHAPRLESRQQPCASVQRHPRLHVGTGTALRSDGRAAAHRGHLGVEIILNTASRKHRAPRRRNVPENAMPNARRSLKLAISLELGISSALPAAAQDSKALPDSSAVTEKVMTSDKSGNATVQLQPSDSAAKVLNGLVIPHWIGASDRFWY